jgi:nicotinamidase-related amidase
LLKYARPMARNLLRLKRRAQKAGVPVIYVNDNFGRWQSAFRRTVEHCTQHGWGREVVKLLRPEDNDYFVLKPKHSGFFSTTLETLLRYLKTQTLIVTGIARNFCVLFTANDAYMRDFNLFVPSDCTVSNIKKGNASALALMRKFLKADTRLSSQIALRAAQKKGQKRDNRLPRQWLLMGLLCLSSRKRKRSRTSPGTERTKLSRFPRRRRQSRRTQTPPLLAQLLEMLQPNLTLFHLL